MIFWRGSYLEEVPNKENWGGSIRRKLRRCQAHRRSIFFARLPCRPYVTFSATRTLASGDVMIIPNGVPHWFKEVQAPFLYYVVKVR